MGLLEKIEAIDMQLVAGNTNNLAYGRTTTNIHILGVHLVKSSAEDRSRGICVVGVLSKVGPIHYLVVHNLRKVILNNNSQ